MIDPIESNELLVKIQAVSELELTQTILIPLFKEFGYERVEYFGGTDEEGKDIICWRRDDIGDVELTVAQVKKYKPTRRADDKQSIHTIVSQLSQASEKEMPFADGRYYLPEIIYFITPFVVDTKVLQARFEAYQILRARRIKIIDGPRLIGLVKKELPELFSSLIGTRAQIVYAMSPQLTNKVLLDALEFPGLRGVETFYTDIDFSLLRPRARALFSSELSGAEHAYFLQREEWVQLSKLNRISLEAVGCGFIEEVERADNEFKAYEQVHSRWQISHSRLAESYFALSKFRTAAEEKIRAEGLSYEVVSILFENENANAGDVYRLAAESLGIKVFNEPPDKPFSAPHIVVSQMLDRKSFGAARQLGDHENELARDYRRILSEHEELNKKYNQSSDSEPEFKVKIKIKGAGLAVILADQRGKIEQEVESFNERVPSVLELENFLRRSTKFLEAAKEILSDPKVALSVSLGERRRKPSEMRVTMSVHNVFDAGVNVALLGDAGAGKTTSLQMYAHMNNATPDKRLAVFVPLSTLARVWQARPTSTLHNGTVPLLEEGIHFYLKSRGVACAPNALVDELRSSRGVLLLDGADEVLRTSPWVVDSISEFSKRVHGVQVIVSSRMTGNYLEKLPFVNIALLPFTSGQREKFIRRWIGESEGLAERILAHLEEAPHIAEIIRNPLLATILCVLAENDVPLPTSEVRLYDERLRLLLGHYDFHKRVRRIQTHSSYLRLVARKIAFRLHQKGQQDEFIEALYKFSEEALSRLLPAEECRRAIDELIDPCGILMPAKEESRLSFGHLRYQEHLAAEEIAQNRGIDIVSLIGNPWWRGAFVLYAQMDQDLESIIHRLYRLARVEGVSSVEQTLFAMVGTLPPEKRSRLEGVLNIGGILDNVIG